MNHGPHNLLPPKAKGILQVIVTNRCDVHWCSNCTQMIPHQRERFDMTPANFRKAVRSLRDYPGIVGMFGGNPVLHPQFDDLCRIFQEERADKRLRGLWTNNLLDKVDIAKETFGHWNLNAHGNERAAAQMKQHLPHRLVWGDGKTNAHAPVMVAAKDLIDDEQAMWATIEGCDINREWSGAVTQRNGELRAYFCEVAAAWDNVYDEDNGLPVYDGWWREGMDAFTAQARRWCPDCGVSLRMKGHDDTAWTYDVSETHAATVTLTAKGRPVVLHDSIGETTPRATDYQGLDKH